MSLLPDDAGEDDVQGVWLSARIVIAKLIGSNKMV
jgi:hypothetical protein